MLKVLQLAFISLAAFTFAEAAATPPPAFPFADGLAVPVDFETVQLTVLADVKNKTVSAEARVVFKAPQEGFPIFDLVPAVESVQLNGSQLQSSTVAETTVPDKITTVRVLKAKVPAASTNELVLTYKVRGDSVTFTSDAVRAAFFMSDLQTNGRGFWEQYGPANFEFDQFTQSIHLKIVGTDTDHVIYTNGKQSSTQKNQFDISFPSHFTASSFYVHVSEQGRFFEKKAVYQGLTKQIPIIVYAANETNAAKGLASAQSTLKHYEETYGPYAHESLVIYVTPTGGGMEYCGATATSLWALTHELAHMWFARGVMPASGNAGWVDEALATWTAEGFKRASRLPNRNPVNLSNFSLYRRDTEYAAYSSGSLFISELDYLFRNEGGMRPLLKGFYSAFQKKVIETSDFENSLEKQAKTDLSNYFNRYVYGKTAYGTIVDSLSLESLEPSTHPRPFTKEELSELL